MPPKQPYDFVIPFHYLLKVIKLLMHGLQCSLVLEDLKKWLTIESSKESTSLEMISYGFLFMISRVVRLVLKGFESALKWWKGFTFYFNMVVTHVLCSTIVVVPYDPNAIHLSKSNLVSFLSVVKIMWPFIPL